MSNPKSIVLVHGGFVDGSGWEGAYHILKTDGFDVIVVQNPTISLANDVDVTKRAIATAKGDVVLVGHSYGGVVVSEAGNDPKVIALVYVTAFAPDKGESVSSLIANPAPGAPVPPILPPVDGSCSSTERNLRRRSLPTFVRSSPRLWETHRFRGVWSLAGSRKRAGVALETKLVSCRNGGQNVPPAAQRAMAGRAGAEVTEAPGSHAIYVSNPEAVASVIKQAVVGAAACAR